MPTMSNYCKAYAASQLREYAGWTEQVPPLVVTSEDEPPPEGERESTDVGPAREEYYYLLGCYGLCTVRFELPPPVRMAAFVAAGVAAARFEWSRRIRPIAPPKGAGT